MNYQEFEEVILLLSSDNYDEKQIADSKMMEFKQNPMYLEYFIRFILENLGQARENLVFLYFLDIINENFEKIDDFNRIIEVFISKAQNLWDDCRFYHETFEMVFNYLLKIGNEKVSIETDVVLINVFINVYFLMKAVQIDRFNEIFFEIIEFFRSIPEGIRSHYCSYCFCYIYIRFCRNQMPNNFQPYFQKFLAETPINEESIVYRIKSLSLLGRYSQNNGSRVRLFNEFALYIIKDKIDVVKMIPFFHEIDSIISQWGKVIENKYIEGLFKLMVKVSIKEILRNDSIDGISGFLVMLKSFQQLLGDDEIKQALFILLQQCEYNRATFSFMCLFISKHVSLSSWSIDQNGVYYEDITFDSLFDVVKETQDDQKVLYSFIKLVFTMMKKSYHLKWIVGQNYEEIFKILLSSKLYSKDSIIHVSEILMPFFGSENDLLDYITKFHDEIDHFDIITAIYIRNKSNNDLPCASSIDSFVINMIINNDNIDISEMIGVLCPYLSILYQFLDDNLKNELFHVILSKYPLPSDSSELMDYYGYFAQVFTSFISYIGDECHDEMKILLKEIDERIDVIILELIKYLFAIAHRTLEFVGEKTKKIIQDAFDKDQIQAINNYHDLMNEYEVCDNKSMIDIYYDNIQQGLLDHNECFEIIRELFENIDSIDCYLSEGSFLEKWMKKLFKHWVFETKILNYHYYLRYYLETITKPDKEEDIPKIIKVLSSIIQYQDITFEDVCEILDYVNPILDKIWIKEKIVLKFFASVSSRFVILRNSIENYYEDYIMKLYYHDLLDKKPYTIESCYISVIRINYYVFDNRLSSFIEDAISILLFPNNFFKTLYNLYPINAIMIQILKNDHLQDVLIKGLIECFVLIHKNVLQLDFEPETIELLKEVLLCEKFCLYIEQNKYSSMIKAIKNLLK